MKKIALIVLLATAGTFQIAHASNPPSLPCAPGTYPTSVGLCQPAWDFD
ncbi:hypothetical protein N5D48_10190 [Pseudomonas sp. GD03858]|nr:MULTISPECIES: hypothetical protein [unclassified Pseudomonas]MDH0647648.1 hypothetical protein [Pseudomonas sp. GD03867]MDH0662772.1 hypothetical protein [Pseudomonas sp. GD03858]